ncbi:MAG: hypothetical protein K940chlam3_01083 [Chlamydiae bacterium]|nr:hypothetical protein [Chlamydiota bacterium]
MSLAELVSLTKEYLNDEFSAHDWIATDRETHQFFRALAIQSKPRIQAPPQVEAPKKTGVIKSLLKTPPKKPVIEKKQEAPVKVKPPQTPKPVSVKEFSKEKPKDLGPQIKLIQEVCPSVKIVEEIPKPAGPKKVLIFTENETTFWGKVAKALSDRGIIVEILKFDENADQISDQNLILVPRSLKPHFESQKIPLVATEEVALYEKDTYLKRVLWQTLCTELRI